jgi:hypothetical protein
MQQDNKVLAAKGLAYVSPWASQTIDIARGIKLSEHQNFHSCCKRTGSNMVSCVPGEPTEGDQNCIENPMA